MSEIIAKAMNSTLGTSNFKAFDKLLTVKSVKNSNDEIYTLPESVDTDEVIRYSQGEAYDENNNYSLKNVFSFKMNLQGGVTIDVPVTCTAATHFALTTKYQVSIRKNYDKLLMYSNWTVNSGGTENKTITFNNVPITPEDILTIRLSVTLEESTPSLTPQGEYSSSISIADVIKIKGTLREHIAYEVL